VGCEALARWEHPERGLLMPDSFIPHAEETGAIAALGDAVLLQACTQVAEWNRARHPSEPLRVAVNLSARQLSSPSLVATVEAALAASRLNPQHLCLEVTESVVMEDVVLSGAALGRLRALGIRTAVDDFGTGYSSLAYLLGLPLDVLKVDRSFVDVLRPDNRPAVAIVRAIAALAEALGLGVLAEGVETQGQLDELRTLGVQQAQGFLWGKAVPASAADWAAPTAPVLPAARRGGAALPAESRSRA
jgi:EAL domain-containing protein (putative c-di-GMP-specific phosphodiesterase class I)